MNFAKIVAKNKNCAIIEIMTGASRLKQHTSKRQVEDCRLNKNRGYKKMEELKSLFGEGSLSYEEFTQKLGEANDIKLANLKSGNYVDKAKYDKLEKSQNEWQSKFSALEESTKGFGELQTSYDSLKAEYDALKTKQEQAEKMSLVASANVNPKFAKFVMAEVQALTNDQKDFQTALGEYLKDNKEFLNPAKGTYADLEKGINQTKTANEIMNNLIRRK